MKALIICTNCEMTALLTDVLKDIEPVELLLAQGSEARNIAASNELDIILSVMPFADGFGLDTAAYISSVSSAEQVVFAPSKVYDEVCSKTVGLDLSVLPKNVNRSLALSIIRKALAMKRDMDAAKKRNEELERKIDEDRLIYRAKCVLIEYLKITEDEAHRILQKRAMDKHLQLYKAALEVLKMYEYRSQGK